MTVISGKPLENALKVCKEGGEGGQVWLGGEDNIVCLSSRMGEWASIQIDGQPHNCGSGEQTGVCTFGKKTQMGSSTCVYGAG